MENSTTAQAVSNPDEQGAAQYELGTNYMLGRGVSADLGMAAASFLNAADLDDPRGLYAAGMMYLKGVGVSANSETAMDFLQKAAALSHSPAKKVLDALSQGKDVSKLPIVVSEAAAAKPSSSAQQQPTKNAVTPLRVLATVVAATVVIAGSGAGYWSWSQQRDKTANTEKAAEENRRMAEVSRLKALADAESQAKTTADKVASAMRDVDAEKLRLSAQQAEIAKQVESLRSLQAARPAEAPAAPSAAPLTASASPAGTVSAWDFRIKEATPHFRKMIEGALANNTKIAVDESAAIRLLPRPARGDRKIARPQNEEGLSASSRQDLPKAIASFTLAAASDESDEEVVSNLGYALVKADRSSEAESALLRALYLNPTRSSAWYNLGLALLAQNQEQAAYGAFLLTYQFAGVQQKSREWFEKLANDDSNPALRRLAQKILISELIKSTS
jgi:TPR repeat protein